jgi:hypothetical protein
MKSVKGLMIVLASVGLMSCSSGNEWFDDLGQTGVEGGSQGGVMPGGAQEGAGGTALTGELASFAVALNGTPLTENDVTVSGDDEDLVENYSESSVITISYQDNNATVTGASEGVSVSTSGAHVTINSTLKNIAYVVSGTTADGSLKIYSEKKFKLTLNGVNITNPTGAAINSQCKKRNYVVLADGTENTLTDGSSYTTVENEDMKATLFAEGQILFSGSGSLTVNANCKNGICSDDYIVFRPGNQIYVKATKSNCVKSNDGIWVRGGVLNLETSGTASKGMKTDGYVQIDGGRVTAITTGNGEYDAEDQDANGAAGVKTDSTFVMNGGELLLLSTGSGGKGISADQDITINGGSIKIITEGQKFTYGSYDTSPKGMKTDQNLTIHGGEIMVRALGGEGSEGIESKADLSITGGSVAVYTYDDAINAKKSVSISGGYVFTYATNNDGIDSNGTLSISGGLVIACGTTMPEDGFDCDQNTFTVTGGTLVGIGGSSSTPTNSTTKQAVALVGVNSLTSGQYLTLDSSDGTNIFAFQLPRSYQQATVLVSSPLMKTGSSYTLSTGASVSDTSSEFYGFIGDAKVSGGSVLSSFSQSSLVTTSNVSGGMGGIGGGPIGPGRW